MCHKNQLAWISIFISLYHYFTHFSKTTYLPEIYDILYLGSIPGRVIPKTQKMVLDASLLNTQHYKVRIKGKVEQSREGVAPSPTPWCSSNRKGSLRVTLDNGRQLYLWEILKSFVAPWGKCVVLNVKGNLLSLRKLISHRLYMYISVSLLSLTFLSGNMIRNVQSIEGQLLSQWLKESS